MDGTGAIAAGAIGEMVVKVLALSAGAGILLEGAALSGARALRENQATASKVAKCVLAVIAVAGAIVATAALGFSATLLVVGLVVSVTSVTKGPILLVGCYAGAAVALGTLFIHWKAFQWSGLVTQTR